MSATLAAAEDAAAASPLPADMRHADDEASVVACFPLMRQLRPHLVSEQEFVARWRRQHADGYRILAVWDGENPLALAGYRIQDNLLHGRHLFVDDLVTSESARGGGHGRRLLAQLAAEGRASGCTKLALGAAMGNTLGHRFYFRNGLLATGFGFTMALS
ncbi:Acetyltransferase (GNAT) family protein [Rhizobiales bacterium GAS188]|nr:Acetyltransferase (GNAT) family protein [Rhizobiales bacterium GAS188]